MLCGQQICIIGPQGTVAVPRLLVSVLERLCIQIALVDCHSLSRSRERENGQSHHLKMKSAAFLGAILAVAVDAVPTVDELYPYTGPKVPVGDWIDPTVKGNGKGFVRLVEPPAVKPASANPTNNVNVISVSYIPNGINIHYQTPFGLGEAPSVVWGLSASELSNTATGKSVTYSQPLLALTQSNE